MELSFQLFSARSVVNQHEFLGTLAGLGYTQVEGYEGVYKEPKAFRTAMDGAGITMPSGHFALQDLEASLAENIEVANTLGLKAIYVPYLQEKDRPTDTAGYKALAQRLMVLNEKIRVAGFEFGWHNHDFEMVALADGGIPMDVLLTEAQGISWEADLAWVHYANADPFEWVAKYGSRLSAVHIKDAAAKGQNLDEDGWADVGEGVIEWKSLLEKIYSVAPDALLIMEHDKPSNAVRFASTSIKNFSSY